MGNELAVISQARQQLEKASTVPEFKAIRDMGKTAIEHAKRLHFTDIGRLNDAHEVVLEAERRAGAALEKMGLHGGDHGNQHTGGKVTGSHLAEFGISKKQSSRWQTEALIPEKEYRDWVQATREANRELSSTALVKMGRQVKQDGSAPQEPIEGVVGSLQELVDQGEKFSCIYADPPWRYGNQATRASTDNHYQTMTVDQICEEPVASIAADRSLLFLWTTTSFLPDSFRVVGAWGFEYKSNMVWVKPQMGIGNYVRVSHEHLLIASRGGLRSDGKSQMSWMEVGRTKHSRKPREFRDAIEKLAAGPYLELYGREHIDGWTVYGNEVEDGLF